MSTAPTLTWELAPYSICTKKAQAAKGHTICIPAGTKEVRIGRGVSGQGCLPQWPQISTFHCRLWMSDQVGIHEATCNPSDVVRCIELCNEHAFALQEPHQWHLEDRSTNGTCVNGERIQKLSSRQLKEGDHIQLAAGTEDPEKVVRYVMTSDDIACSNHPHSFSSGLQVCQLIS